MARLVYLSLFAGMLWITASCARSPQEHLRTGNEFFKSQKFAEAALHYQKAIQKDPNYGDAYYRLGLSELKNGNKPGAYAALTRAAELLPENAEAKVELANLALEGYLADPRRPKGLYDQIQKLSNSLLSRNADSYDALRLKGVLSFIDRRFAEAATYLSKAAASHPLEPSAVEVLAQSLMQSGGDVEGERVAKELVQKQPQYLPIYDVLYRYYTSHNRSSDAERVVRTKFEKNPDEPGPAIDLAAHYFAAGRQAEMTLVLEQLVKNSKNPDTHLRVGDFYASIEKPATAYEQYSVGAQAQTNDRKRSLVYQKRRASALISMQKRVEALKLLGQLVQDHPDDYDLRADRAALLLSGGTTAERASALTELKDLAVKQPNNSVIQYNLGRAYAVTNNVDQARKAFINAAKQSPTFLGPRLALSELSLRASQYREARQYAEEVLSVDQRNSTARSLRASSLVGLGQFDQASSDIRVLERELPQSPEPKLQAGVLQAAQKNYLEAERILTPLYQSTDSNIRVVEALARTYVAQKRSNEAISLLNRELAKHSDSKELRTLLADAAAAAGRHDIAIEQRKLLVNTDEKVALPTVQLGEAYMHSGDLNSAIAQFTKAVSIDPSSRQAHAMLALALSQAGRSGEAKSSYRETLKLNPTNALAMNNLAYLMAESGEDLDTALELAQNAMRQMPNSAIADTVGWVYLKKNMSDSAIQIFSNSVRQDPKNAIYRYHLALALSQKGDKKQAKTELLAALSLPSAQADEQKMRALLQEVNKEQ